MPTQNYILILPRSVQYDHTLYRHYPVTTPPVSQV